MDEKTCETCRWYRNEYRVCASWGTTWMKAARNRDIGEKCGPSGRYWEPRESEE